MYNNLYNTICSTVRPSNFFFTVEELVYSDTALRLGIDNTPPEPVRLLLDDMTSRLSILREHLGPMIVSSGFRCLELNESLGSSPQSYHVKGRAVDLLIPSISDWHPSEQMREIITASRLGGWTTPELGIRKIIHETRGPYGPSWIHMSFVEPTRLTPFCTDFYYVVFPDSDTGSTIPKYIRLHLDFFLERRTPPLGTRQL